MTIFAATLLAMLFGMLGIGLVPVLRRRRVRYGCGAPNCCSDQEGETDERSASRS